MNAFRPFIDQPVHDLTLDNFPDNITPFEATDFDDALDKIERFLMIDGKHSAVWIMGDETPYDELEIIRENFFRQFFDAAKFVTNYRKKIEEIGSFSNDPMIEALSPEALIAFKALTKRNTRLDLIQRYQLHTADETSLIHLDFPTNHSLQEPPRELAFLKGRRVRFLFLEAGENPFLFGTPKAKLKVSNILTGSILNVEDLGSIWQAKGRTFTAITNLQYWREQAIAHASPRFSTTPDKFRAQTVYTLI